MILPDASNAKKYRLNAKYDQFAIFYIKSYAMNVYGKCILVSLIRLAT